MVFSLFYTTQNCTVDDLRLDNNGADNADPRYNGPRKYGTNYNGPNSNGADNIGEVNITAFLSNLTYIPYSPIHEQQPDIVCQKIEAYKYPVISSDNTPSGNITILYFMNQNAF